ncbi:hypothetical protein EBU94_00240 [bacterium]|nr:hypothetical protein [bacterium]
MSIKPPIKCPPDYSILAFRLTECKKAGIVKGITTQLAMDLQDLFVPLANYEERKITLKAGQTKKIDVSSIGETWPLQESYEIVADPAKCGFGTSHSYSLYDSNLTLIETINFSVDATYPTFQQALTNAVTASTQIKNLLSLNASTFADDGIVTITATAKETKYRHLFSFDVNGFGGYYPFPYLHPGNLVTKNQKYIDPRVKLMLIYPDFYKSSLLSNCNCTDASGDLKSNVKWIEYAYNDQYTMVSNPQSPITLTPVVNSLTQWLWNQSSTDHIGYHFKVGDLVSIPNSTNPNLRGFITEIQGFLITIDTTIGDILTPNQNLYHIYSPSEIKWRKMGDIYLHSTAQDVLNNDYLYLETLWLRNPHNYDLPIKIMIAS